MDKIQVIGFNKNTYDTKKIIVELKKKYKGNEGFLEFIAFHRESPAGRSNQKTYMFQFCGINNNIQLTAHYTIIEDNSSPLFIIGVDESECFIPAPGRENKYLLNFCRDRLIKSGEIKK